MVNEPEPVDTAPTRGQGRTHCRTKGFRCARGEAPLQGQARAASSEPAYEFENPTEPILPPSSLDAMPLVKGLLLHVLDKHEGAPSTYSRYTSSCIVG